MTKPKQTTGYRVEADSDASGAGRFFKTFAEAEAFARRRASRSLPDRAALDRVWLQLTAEGGWFLDEAGL